MSPVVRRILISLTLMLVPAVSGLAEYQFLGGVTSVSKESSGVLLGCGKDLVRVSILEPGTCRITLARSGAWDDGPDYSIAKSEWPACSVQISETAETITLKTSAMEIRVTRNPCRFSFFDPDGRLFNRDDPAFGMAWDGTEVGVFKSLQPGEMFFGLGEKGLSLNRAGRELSMWNTDIPNYQDRTDPLYESHPFYIGLSQGRAYGVFFNNSYRSYFSMGSGNHRFAHFRATDGKLDYFFFAGPGMKQVLSRYSELVGRSPLPPKWSLGYQQCRYSYYPEAEVRSIAQTFRDKKIPADVIYLDIHYMDGYRCFTFDKQRFPDPDKMLADLKAQGFKIVTIVDPVIKVDPGYPVYDSGLAGDHFVKLPDGERYVGDVWPGPSHFADYTRPETRKWWGDLVGGFLNTGIAGIWNDMNEPAVWGVETPWNVQFRENGKSVSIKKIHNLFGHLMAQSTYEGMLRRKPDERPFILTRAGFSGTQRYAAVWTGDNATSFESLENAIRMSQSMGISGITFAGADVGGFWDSPSTELFVRWMEAGAFIPFFRNHTMYDTQAQEPWSFGREAENICRTYINLRYQLMPYTYTAFRAAESDGSPVMRPLFFENQNDPDCYWDGNYTTFYWGSDIIVAPVTAQGQTIRKVYLPEGIWHDFRENRTYPGKAYAYVDAPLGKLPLFVRGGSVIPMQEVQQYVGEKPVDLVQLHVYPGEARVSSMYEDDGVSFGYRKDGFRRTSFTVESEKNRDMLTISAPEGKYEPVNRSFEIILHGQKQRPVLVQIDGKPVESGDLRFDPNAGTVSFRREDDGREHRVAWWREK
jgi:alpha-glucosidase